MGGWGLKLTFGALLVNCKSDEENTHNTSEVS